MKKAPHVAILPSPGMGHLIPLVEFAKRLVTHHNLSATFIVPNDGPLSKSQHAFLDSLPEAISYLLLPPVNFQDLPPDATIETRISLMVTRSIPSLRHTFQTMAADKAILALFVDLFGTDAFDVAIEFGVSPYIFFPASALTLSLLFHLPKLDQTISGPFTDLPDPIQIPGCVPIPGTDLVDPLHDRNNDGYKWVLHNAKRYTMARGIAVNSFEEMEAGAIQALRQNHPRLYPVGPLIRAGSAETSGDVECLRWLDGQPCGSVLYVSFGSGGTLSSDQLTELAMGLESSGQRFLWVVRSPNDGAANATYFNAHGHNDPFGFLPKGFLDRTKSKGLVVSSWAPQAQILSHGSTGGFLTHCGWNSTLETVVQGVPMIVWPLYAEQKMNAVMLSKGLKVALRARPNQSEIVDRVQIAGLVKGLMEGEEGKEIKIRIGELKEAAKKVVGKDGRSTKTLEQLVSTFT